MALPDTGSISHADIMAEFGLTGEFDLSKDGAALISKTPSEIINESDFYGASDDQAYVSISDAQGIGGAFQLSNASYGSGNISKTSSIINLSPSTTSSINGLGVWHMDATFEDAKDPPKGGGVTQIPPGMHIRCQWGVGMSVTSPPSYSGPRYGSGYVCFGIGSDGGLNNQGKFYYATVPSTGPKGKYKAYLGLAESEQVAGSGIGHNTVAVRAMLKRVTEDNSSKGIANNNQWKPGAGGSNGWFLIPSFPLVAMGAVGVYSYVSGNKGNNNYKHQIRVDSFSAELTEER